MVGCKTWHHLGCNFGRLGDQGSHQAAFAALGQSHGFFHVVIRHQRADWTKGFKVVNAVGAHRLLAQQQGRLEERAIGHALAHQAEIGITTANQLGTLAQHGHTLSNVCLL